MLGNHRYKLDIETGKGIVAIAEPYFLYDFVNRKRIVLSEFVDYNIIAFDSIANCIVFNSKSITKKNTLKTNLIIYDLNNNRILFESDQYLVFNADFSNDHNYVIIEANKKPLLIFNLTNNTIVEGLSQYCFLFKGNFLKNTHTFFVPVEKSKGKYFVLDLKEKSCKQFKTAFNNQIYRIKPVDESRFICIDELNILRLHNDNSIVWELDLYKLTGVKCYTNEFFTIDNKTIVFNYSILKSNTPTITILSIDLKTGHIISETERDAVNIGGLIDNVFINNKFITYGGRVIDLEDNLYCIDFSIF